MFLVANKPMPLDPASRTSYRRSSRGTRRGKPGVDRIFDLSFRLPVTSVHPPGYSACISWGGIVVMIISTSFASSTGLGQPGKSNRVMNWGLLRSFGSTIIILPQKRFAPNRFSRLPVFLGITRGALNCLVLPQTVL
jgi:hypothetical protein